VVDADHDNVIARISLGQNAGDVVFDDDLHLVFVSDSVGKVSIIRQDFPDKYRLVDTVHTGLGRSTLALDAITHRVFVAPTQSLQPRLSRRNAAVSISVVGR